MQIASFVDLPVADRRYRCQECGIVSITMRSGYGAGSSPYSLVSPGCLVESADCGG
jgi:hypothetical protein